MPILTTIRQSPAYLYVKTYCLCAVITLFQAAPVSSQLPRIRLARLQKNRPFAPRLKPRSFSRYFLDKRSAPNAEKYSIVQSLPAQSGPGNILKRWLQRAIDLAYIKKQLRIDDKDVRTYPELNWDATVRRSSSLHPEEQHFIKLRKIRISSQGTNSLHTFLNLPKDEQVDPQDVPLIAIGGSGGGYRAMYGFVAFISASKKLGLWDCVTWTAGVSGSCWTLAAYYTIGNRDVSRLLRHYLSVAREAAHPMSLHAFDTIVRSSKGVYFLLGPLVRKVRSGIIGLGIMDLYGTLTTTYQLLSREPSAKLSRATFQFSKVWTRSGIDKGLEPMPIFTAVRRAPRNSSGVISHTDSSLSKGQPPIRALTQHQTKVPYIIECLQRQKFLSMPTRSMTRKRVLVPDSSLSNGFFQWFEISPLEVGSPDVNRYIQTWSWGRSFVSGHSVGRPPEQSLALLLGQCTSAPAGPLTGYISALLASLPKGTVMSRLLLLLNDFVRMKNWERLWGNPIRAGHDPNPFYGHNNLPQPKIVEAESQQSLASEKNSILMNSHQELTRPDVHETKHKASQNGLTSVSNSNSHPTNHTTPPSQPPPKPIKKPTWEQEGRIRLMDSGMSNNLPSHVLARPSRAADIILAFDTSSDVQSGSAIRRIQNFAEDCKLVLTDETESFEMPKRRFGDGEEKVVEERWLGKYVRVFRGVRREGGEMWLVYCPLLPVGEGRGFDPSTASFSTSYNLAWTPEQIQMLFSTSEANLTHYTIETIREVVRKVYLTKKERRLQVAIEPESDCS